MDFKERVAIVTGSGGGLGREYALELARRGARVMVNDLGGARDGTGSSLAAAQAVVAEIEAAGGTAMANGASVTDPAAVEEMIAAAQERWGRVDILINNAGILRDKSFAKMTLEDFRVVLEVNLMGSVICSKAVWEIMRQQGYGRILMATSSSGLYGNFGQANYCAAKAGLVGLMKTLALEGARSNVRVNAIAPLAATRMTDDVIPAEALDRLGPDSVVPAAVFLVSEEAPTNVIMNAGGGGFEATHVAMTRGIHVERAAMSAESVAARYTEIIDRTNDIVPQTSIEQGVVALGGPLSFQPS